MPELGWVLAAIALVGVVVLGVLLRRASTRSAEDRASWEKRSRADIASASGSRLARFGGGDKRSRGGGRAAKGSAISARFWRTTCGSIPMAAASAPP